MLNYLLKLKEAIDTNWNYFYKILFSFSIYLLYKGFLKVLTFEDMAPYNLIFIIIGFIVFSLDKLINPIIDIYKLLFRKNEEISPNRKKTAIIVFIFFIIMISATLGYYIFSFYPFVNITIFSLMVASLTTSLFINHTKKSINSIIKIVFIILASIGIAGIVHSFYLNENLNINTFTLVFVIGFFIFDYLLNNWKEKYFDAN